MPPDRMRASDHEREAAVALLRAAAAEGRLEVEELDERTAAAYAAKTRGELEALTEDLPDSRLPAARPAAAPRRSLPRIPGRMGFSARWRAPVGLEQAGRDLLEFVAPPMRAFGYELVERTPERLVFQRDVRPAWTLLVAIFAFPFGLLALLHTQPERITIE